MTDGIILLVLIIVLLAFSGFFSGSETAFAQVNKIRLKKNADAGDKRSMDAQKIVDNFTRSLSTILVGNNLVNIAASSAVTVLALTWFPAHASAAQAWGSTALTVALLIFGEILPKIVAAEYADELVLIAAKPVRWLTYLFTPVVATVTAMVQKLEHLWTPSEEQPGVTQNELITLVDSIEDEGVFTEKEGDLIKSAIEFTDVTAREIMTPRVDVEAFDIEDGAAALARNKHLLQYSRFPVCRGSIDNVIGMIQTKKYMREAVRRGGADKLSEEDFLELMHEALFVHMTRPISSILKEFGRTSRHMAIVVDEFGGTMGILTLEDILEEIVGDIYDEHDEVEREVISADDDSGRYVIDAAMNIYDLFELLDFNPEAHDFESEYTTVGGFVTELLDRFPKAGDKVSYANLTFTVLEAHPTHADKIEVFVEEE